MVNPQTPQRLYVPREQAIQAGRFLANYKLIWIAGFFFIWVGAIVGTSAAGVLWIGLLLTVLLPAVYVGLIGFPLFDGLQTTALAKAFRTGSRLYHGMMGHQKYFSDQPLAGEVFGVINPKPKRPKPITRLGRIDFLAYETADGPLGIAWDRRYKTYSATLWAAGSSLLSANQSVKMERLNGFAGLQDTMAESGNMIHRFSWREQTLVGEHQRPEQLVQDIRAGAQLTRESPPNQEVLLARTAQMGDSSVTHWTTMTLTVYRPQVRREAKSMGGIEELLVAQLKAFHAAVMGTESGRSPIGLKAARFLTYNDLVLENRLVLDPVFAQPIWQGLGWAGPKNSSDRLDQQNAWPGFANFEPDDYCQLGETYHMGFYLSEFTRSGMPPDQFWNILKVPVPKTVVTVFQMLPLRRGQRWAEWRTTGAAGTNFDRMASRRRVTASQARSAQEAIAHETEIAENKGQVGRIRCYLDLTGESLEAVRASASQMRHAWTDARFILEPLIGRQHLGIEAIMPIGRGLTTLSVPRRL